MLSLFTILLPLLSLAAAAEPAHSTALPPAKLRYSPDCILRAMAERRQITLNPKLKPPAVFFESTTPLRQFQDAIEPQWNQRPERFSSAYVYAGNKNEIYLIDEAAYYAKYQRYIDDSLAHELVHYLQVVYQHYDLAVEFTAEDEAVMAQTWFRETFLATGKSPCP